MFTGVTLSFLIFTHFWRSQANRFETYETRGNVQKVSRLFFTLLLDASTEDLQTIHTTPKGKYVIQCEQLKFFSKNIETIKAAKF